MQFKEQKHEDQYEELKTRNPRLQLLVKLLDDYVGLNFHKQITLTEVYRTTEEQKALYAQTPNPPEFSPHMVWSAVDIRSSVFTEEEINKMVAFLNTFVYKAGAKPVCLYHMIAGNTWHFHIQFC